MIKMDELTSRFETLQKTVLDELAERDRDIMTAESEIRPGDNNLKPVVLAEQKMERRARALKTKTNGKARNLDKVRDFISSIRAERMKRKYPLESSSQTENVRRSEFLTMKAEKFVEAVDNFQAFADEFLAGEVEYQSRLLDWAELKHLFAGDGEARGEMTTLKGKYEAELDLPAIMVLQRRAEGLLRRLQYEFALAEAGQSGSPKNWEQSLVRAEIMETIYTGRTPVRDPGLDAFTGQRA